MPRTQEWKQESYWQSMFQISITVLNINTTNLDQYNDQVTRKLRLYLIFLNLIYCGIAQKKVPLTPGSEA